jgi:signal peptide peptidase SppA
MKKDFKLNEAVLKAQRFLNQPAMISFGFLDKLAQAFENPSYESFLFMFGDEKSAEMRIEDGIAYIPVVGPLTNSSRDAFLDETSYEQIRKNIDKALATDDVKHIVFEFDTPGGEVAGVFDLAAHIRYAQEKKPMSAVLNQAALSAGYLLASAVGDIRAPEFSQIGSVGVLSMHVDMSEMDKMRGLKYEPVFAGAKKVQFSPHQPLSESTRAEMQANVDKIYNRFVAVVSHYRGISEDAVRATDAGIFHGSEGVELGLADVIQSWEDAVQAITSNSYGGNVMNLKEQLEALKAKVSPEEWDKTIALIGLPEDTTSTITTLQAERDWLMEMVGELGKEIQTLKDLPETDTEANTRIQTLETSLSDVQTQLKETQKQLMESAEAKRTMEIESEVIAIGVIGDPKAIAKRLFTLENIDPALYAEEIDQMKKVAEALKNAKIFTEVGSSGGGAAGDPGVKLMDIVRQKIEAGTSEAQAWREAAKENPDLYRAYRNGS